MPAAPAHSTLDIQKIRTQFPALQQTVHGKPLIYLDNAATTQKPQAVLDALTHYYQYDNANVHRGVHTLAERATFALEATRRSVQQFIRATDTAEIIFTSGTTASINLVAATYGQTQVQAGDEIIISHMEHHANIVPWQMLCQAKRAVLKVIPINKKGRLMLSTLANLLTSKTKIVAIGYVSNVLGTINPLKEIIQQAHTQGAIVVVDGAQAVPHLPIDVQELDCDFLAFSAHKAYGPTGVGVLYGKKALLEDMPPYQGGGEMTQQVTLSHTTYNDLPYRFEAGTPNIAGIIAWQEALNFIKQVGYKTLMAHENKLLNYAADLLSSLKKIRIIGTAPNKIGVLSFVVEGMHHLDVGMLLDANGIAVRTGHGCAQPLIDLLKIEGIVRASFAIYNTKEEVEQFVTEVTRIVQKKA
ncbi:MAG: SufS family cysteine desulfurase [Amoebophilaceae bacterium]|jgi:cysteine desulfurase/selenocysteine lyase|nr:SufS family cysteine desulfurase [Amoebophilaceae bacterium]